MTLPLPGLFVMAQTNQRNQGEEGGTSGGARGFGAGWVRRGSGFVYPQSGARALGTQRRRTDKGHGPRGRLWARLSVSLGCELDSGRGSPVGSISALLNNGSTETAPGLRRGVCCIPGMGEGSGSDNVDGAGLSLCCSRQLTSGLRGQRCHPHFGDGETKALADSFSKPTSVPPLSTC